jgi:hypothetical protein
MKQPAPTASSQKIRSTATAIDPVVARSVLTVLGGLPPNSLEMPEAVCAAEDLAPWLIERDLAPLAEARYRVVYPELAYKLKIESYSVTAHTALHWQNLQAVDAGFAAAGLTALLLKGAALAHTVYDQPEQRPMNDVDLWLPKPDMAAACAVMATIGFDSPGEKEERPLALQALSGGEIQFINRTQPPTLVELHFAPLAGWWLTRTAVVDTAAVWGRREPLSGWHSFYQLAPEDTVIQLAVHMSVNHQFGLAALRSLVDIALTAQVRSVDWQIVAERAASWHVATAVWLVLSLLQDLLAMPGLDDILQQLQPAAWRRRQLQRIISPEMLLAGGDLRHGRERFLLLLLLVDRLPDAVRLVYRTLWPEQSWLDARYGDDINSWQHMARIVRQGDI